MPPPPEARASNAGESSPQNDSRNRAQQQKDSQTDNAGSNAGSNDNKNENNLGSGLVSFFGDFLPETDGGFSTSLSDLPPPKDPMEMAKAIEAKVIGVQYIDGGLFYGEWRRKEKEYLTEYLTRRLHPHPEDETGSGDSTFSSSCGESSDNDHEAAETSQPPESQLGMETQEEPLATSPIVKKSRKNTIPFVEDCLHDLTKLEFLDLHARTLSLNLSKIHKIWRLRDTKRIPKNSIRKPVFFGRANSTTPQQHSRKQKLVFEEKEDDGPVATIYKKVVHLEVEQLHLDGQLLPPQPNRQFPQRIKVFFYNSYAIAVSEWIRQQNQEQQRHSGTKRKHCDNSGTTSTTTIDTTGIVMRLSNIPACCIFPYALDPRNWREKQELVDYCLCIGDKSVATTRKNQPLQPGTQPAVSSSEHIIRFDSNEMEIRLMAVVTKTTTSETGTAADSIVTNETIEEVDLSSEVVLSRRAFAKEFLSSSGEEATPEGEEEVQKSHDNHTTTSPLQTSWEKYQKNRSPKGSDSKRQTSSTSNERAPLCQLNQNGQQQPQDQVHTNDEQSKKPRNDNDEQVIVEPMTILGEVQRRSDSKNVNYVQLGKITTMVEQSISAGKGCNFKVNLYASVVAVTPPRITKRGDWMIAATLLDESSPTPMTINIFCKEKDQLPKLIWMGDVIRIHRAAVEKWYNKIQLQGLKPTQYVVIRKIGGNWQVIPTAQNYFTFDRSDEERSQALWRWANQNSEKSPSMKPEHCFTLEEMQHLKKEDDETTFEHKDITVMVVQKLRYQSSDVLPHGLLRVWDGTGNTPSDPFFMPGKLFNPLPEEQRQAAYAMAVEKVISTSQQLQSSVGTTMEIPISLAGRLSNVVIWEKSHWALIQKHIPVGTFLRLRNVHIPQRWEANNFRSIFMHDKSWMTGLPTNNFEVRSLLYHHNERVRRCGSQCYNREFGYGHDVCSQFVGKGLSHFCREETTKQVYTGAVRIGVVQEETGKEIASSAAAKVIVADRSSSVEALVASKIYHQLQNMAGATSWNRRFLVTIYRIVLDDDDEEDEKQHFVITNLAPMDGWPQQVDSSEEV